MNIKIKRIKENYKIELIVFKKYTKHDLYKIIPKINLSNKLNNITENLFYRKISSISRY